MDGSGTGERAEAGQPCRALVAQAADRGAEGEGRLRRLTGGRPMAGFLAQLIVANDPSLHPPRGERTRTAATLYARAATLAPERRRA